MREIINYFCQICNKIKNGVPEKCPVIFKFYFPEEKIKKKEGYCCKKCLKEANKLKNKGNICLGIGNSVDLNYIEYLKYENILFYGKVLTKRIDDNIIKSIKCEMKCKNKICTNCVKLKSKLNYLKNKLIKFENFNFDNDDEYNFKKIFKNLTKFERNEIIIVDEENSKIKIEKNKNNQNNEIKN
jgi:hypothetical protein